jgi:hypothetical protein
MKLKVVTTTTEVMDAQPNESIAETLHALVTAKSHRLTTFYQVSLVDEDGVEFASNGGFGR